MFLNKSEALELVPEMTISTTDALTNPPLYKKDAQLCCVCVYICIYVATHTSGSGEEDC